MKGPDGVHFADGPRLDLHAEGRNLGVKLLPEQTVPRYIFTNDTCNCCLIIQPQIWPKIVDLRNHISCFPQNIMFFLQFGFRYSFRLASPRADDRILILQPKQCSAKIGFPLGPEWHIRDFKIYHRTVYNSRPRVAHPRL